VRTWFDQPGRKLRRRTARKTKAATLGVRPTSLLRPAVRAQTVRYNRKVREGRGFTLAELKEAGIGRKEARGVGVVVDHRRRNLSEEGKKINVDRLKAYKARLIVFPRKAGKPKTGDSSVSNTPRLFYFILMTLVSGRRPQGRDNPCCYPSPHHCISRSPPKNHNRRARIPGIQGSPCCSRKPATRGCSQSSCREGQWYSNFSSQSFTNSRVFRKRRRKLQRRSSLRRPLHTFFGFCLCTMLTSNPSQNVDQVIQTYLQPMPYAMNMFIFGNRMTIV
jgi:ribosomal protein L13E